MAWMAQFLRYPVLSRGVESPQQAAQRVNYRLAADCLAVAGKNGSFGFRCFVDSTPAKAYGAHWLTT